ncbi:hypothetical protein L6452_00596 [Arctium lappa]|uniref:Uncharacterized protein n=1 Tax=Arctium lappa TaxID=4217 RepID=A0ACB9FES4_ARCLA|nr:hypothetical protein L6452_00596 [Arctium lappa]
MQWIRSLSSPVTPQYSACSGAFRLPLVRYATDQPRKDMMSSWKLSNEMVSPTYSPTLVSFNGDPSSINPFSHHPQCDNGDGRRSAGRVCRRREKEIGTGQSTMVLLGRISYHLSSEFRTFDSWKITSNASNDGSDCCLWDGVVCNNEEDDGHVIGLDLSERFLRGHINSSSSLFSLVHLQTLNLAMNDFTESEIPSQISRLKQLRTLNLSESGFSGQILNEVSHLMQLSSLDLSWNSLKLKSPSLEKLVQNLTRLEELDLSGVDISSSLPRFLANFSSLGQSSLKIVFIKMSSLANMTQLTYLDLSHNEFTGVVPSLVSLTKVTVLDLSDSRLEKRCLPDWLVKLTKLKELYVNRMDLYGEIPPFLANLTKLSLVGMRGNSLSGCIPSSFMNLTQLSTIDLGINQLQGPISSSFSNFKRLQHLHLDHNNFSGRVELDWFIGLDKLESLWLGGNKISVVANTKNYTNGTLPELRTLDLSSCNLKEYPALLHFQHKLRFLFLFKNKIHGLIPEWGWNNSQETLEMIDLSYNFSTGFHQHQHFPSWIRLKIFRISNNLLQGRLPVPPRTTEVYTAKNNNLEGEIPPLICELKSLRFLHLSSNSITGILPPCFGSLSNSLFKLDLSSRHNDEIIFQGQPIEDY